MTCGCCDPEAFRENDNRVIGYVVASRPSRAAGDTRRLYYLGAELVLVDPPKGRVIDRPAFKLLRQIMRRGDKLVLASEKALGTKPTHVEANCASLEADGIEIAIMRKEYFEGL